MGRKELKPSLLLLGFLLFTVLAICRLVPQEVSAELSPTPDLQSSLTCPFQGIELTLRVKLLQNVTPSSELVERVRAVLARRLSNLDFTQAAIQATDANVLTIQLAGVEEVEQSIALLNSVGRLDFRFQKSGTENQLPAQIERRQQQQTDLKMLRQGEQDRAIIAIAEAELVQVDQAIAQLFEPTQLTSAQIQDASAQPGNGALPWEVVIVFNQAGSQQFTELTRRMAGTGRSIGIFIDDRLISAPVVDARYAETGITGGSASITGNFNAQEASNLAAQLRSGALPAPIEILSQTTVNRTQCQ